MTLYDRFGIKKGLTAVVGSGGKTTLIAELAGELMTLGTVIVATSTKIYRPSYCPVIIEAGQANSALIAQALAEHGCVCVGTLFITPCGEEKLSSPLTSFEELKNMADYVLVEADGSKHLPLKAHAPFEPVIPNCSDRTIMVIGMSGIGRPIDEVVHRSDIMARLVSAQENDIVTEEMVAKVINTENYGDVVYCTQIEGSTDEAKANKLADLINKPVVVAERRIHGV